MLTPELVQQIRQLLEGKLSQRKIARLTGASRGTVAAIASGKRPDHEGRRQACEGEPSPSDGPPQRCPQCGGWVFMPCHRCRIERLIRESRVARLPERPEEEVASELLDKHRRRYERVRARRLARLRSGEES
jgi:transcriptional regulator with XRE-family HTH domain